MKLKESIFWIFAMTIAAIKNDSAIIFTMIILFFGRLFYQKITYRLDKIEEKLSKNE